MISKTLIVNGMTKTLLVNPEDSLADVLRGQLLLTSVKVGCGTGQCGACNVILDGKLVRTCTLKMKRVEDGAAVTTLEGIGTPEHMHPLQLSWMFHGGAQCGFCTPGFIVSAKCLLDNNPAPTRNDVRDWFQSHRNACRCTGYKPLVDAVMDAAAVMRGEKSVKDIEYKEPVDGRTWGSRRPRPNAVAKVTGTHDFGADTALKMPPDTLHLALAQAKVSHANIKGIDTSEAEAMPGVYRVLTHKDVKGKNRITGLITFPTNKGDGWDRPILNDTKIFQYGDALAIVCADSEAHARAAADKATGKIKAMEADWIVDHGPYSEFGDLLTLRGAQYIGAGYGIENIRGLGKTVCTNHGWGAAFRGYGAPESEFASEVLIDELAEKLGMDPLELRAVNCYKPGDTNPSGQAPEVFSLPDMIDIMRPKFKAAKEKAAANSTDTVKRGVGVAIGIYGCGLDGPDSAESWAQYNEDGTVTIGVCWGDHGQGADAGALGTAHEALRPLNIAADKIRLVMNDTSKATVGGPAGGSRSQLVVGNAIRVACETLIEAMKKPGGGFYTYDEMKAEGREVRQYGKWTTPCTSPDENGQGEPFCCYMYGLFMAEVAVDITTGKTAVEKLTMIADIGKVNNRLVTDGQLYGGLAQGIGLALTEDYEDIKKHSTLIGAGLPYIKDVPDDIELIYLENSRKDGPFGASGVGELPLTAPHAAIINAIYQACGARVRHLPARPEKVLAALKK